jgi:hypothetical protein
MPALGDHQGSPGLSQLLEQGCRVRCEVGDRFVGCWIQFRHRGKHSPRPATGHVDTRMRCPRPSTLLPMRTSRPVNRHVLLGVLLALAPASCARAVSPTERPRTPAELFAGCTGLRYKTTTASTRCRVLPSCVVPQLDACPRICLRLHTVCNFHSFSPTCAQAVGMVALAARVDNRGGLVLEPVATWMRAQGEPAHARQSRPRSGQLQAQAIIG